MNSHPCFSTISNMFRNTLKRDKMENKYEYSTELKNLINSIVQETEERANTSNPNNIDDLKTVFKNSMYHVSNKIIEDNPDNFEELFHPGVLLLLSVRDLGLDDVDRYLFGKLLNLCNKQSSISANHDTVERNGKEVKEISLWINGMVTTLRTDLAPNKNLDPNKNISNTSAAALRLFRHLHEMNRTKKQMTIKERYVHASILEILTNTELGQFLKKIEKNYNPDSVSNYSDKEFNLIEYYCQRFHRLTVNFVNIDENFVGNFLSGLIGFLLVDD